MVEYRITFNIVDVKPTLQPIENVKTPENKEIKPIPIVTGGDPNITISVTGLPEGLKYNPETKQI